MNPPPRRPDDDTPPPPTPGEPAPPSGRDPLLDDPVFAELVDSPAGPVAEPLYAEPVAEPAAADLPVAEPVGTGSASRPATEAVDAEPVEEPPPPPPPEPEPLPRAYPVRPDTTSPAPRRELPPSTPSNSGPRPVPAPPDRPPPKPRVMTACCVLGCLGGATIGAVAFLAFVAITVLGYLGDRIGTDRDREFQHAGATGGRPGPVAPTSLPRSTTVPLGATFDAVGRGAGGRYLLLRMPRQQTIAVFDPNTGTVVRTLSVGDPKALFACGAAKLFVYRSEGEIDRYDLVTWEKEQTTPAPTIRGGADAIAVGPGADGPVYLCSVGEGRPADVRVIDPVSLKQTAAHRINEWKGRADGQVLVRPSDDGTVLGVTGDKGALVIRFSPGANPRVVQLRPNRGAAPVLATPSPDGQFVYTPRGVFDPDGKHLLGADKSHFFTVPTAHGSGLYLSFDVIAGQVEGSPKLHAADKPSLQSLVSLESVAVEGDLPANEVRAVPADQRVYLWPVAGLAAVLPPSNDQIKLYKIDVAELLKQSGQDYVVFATDPPTTAHPGVEWRYRPVVWVSRAPRAALEVVSGPPGMQVSAGRDVVWTPTGRQAGPVGVRLRANDPLLPRNHAEQHFRIVVTENPEE